MAIIPLDMKEIVGTVVETVPAKACEIAATVKTTRSHAGNDLWNARDNE